VPVFKTVGTDDGLEDSSITAVQQDRQGRIWIGTRTAGVFVRDSARWRKIRGTDARVVQAMRALKDGRVIGADSQGPWLSTGMEARRILNRPDASLGSFRAFSEDYGDHIYFSDSSGVYRLPLPGAQTPERISETSSVRSLIETDDGVWAVSWDHGLLHIAGGATTEYSLGPQRSLHAMTLHALTPGCS
jgi:ligand-binding sensor domain-containing protein